MDYKEEALELVIRFTPIANGFTQESSFMIAKRTALVCLDVMMEERNAYAYNQMKEFILTL